MRCHLVSATRDHLRLRCGRRRLCAEIYPAGFATSRRHPARVRRCRPIRQPLVGSRGCNNCSAVRMTDENSRAADPSERFVDCCDIAFESVETILGRDHFVPLRLKRWDQFTKARTIRPKSVGENNTWFCCHICLSLLLGICVEHSLASS